MIISYAQHNEDILLHALLYEKKNGFYVDVGANDPTNDSVTKFFYLRKWSGINIEPIPQLYDKLKKSRPRDININAGIAQKKGELRLKEYGMGRHGLSSFVENSKAPDYLPFKEYTVPVLPLRDILSKHKVKQIDFMKIDVEGMEFEVIKSNDWKKYKPSVLLIEDNGSADWLSYIIDKGYREVCFDGLNRYFVSTDLSLNINKYQDILNQEVVTHKSLLLKKDIEDLQLKLQDMYEKHTHLGEKWNSLQSSPENFLNRKQLTKALVKKYKSIAKSRLTRQDS